MVPLRTCDNSLLTACETCEVTYHHNGNDNVPHSNSRKRLLVGQTHCKHGRGELPRSHIRRVADPIGDIAASSMSILPHDRTTFNVLPGCPRSLLRRNRVQVHITPLLVRRKRRWCRLKSPCTGSRPLAHLAGHFSLLRPSLGEKPRYRRYADDKSQGPRCRTYSLSFNFTRGEEDKKQSASKRRPANTA